MNKKIKTLLSLGLVSVITASSMLPVNALSKTTYKKFTTTSCSYIVINGVKCQLPLSPLCPNKPDTNPEKPEDNNSDSTSKPDTNPEKPEDNNSGSTSKPDTDPEKPEDNNSGSTSKPDTDPEKPEDNNSDSTTGNFSDYQKQVLDLVNVERAKVGLNALVLDSSVSDVATLKSKDMIDNNYFSHTSPTYGSPFDMLKKFGISYKSAGENIAYGQNSPKEVVTAWMNSQGHRENILNANFTNLGVGIAKNSKGTIYWTQMFIGK
ncbi:CAP domain-containing protein [Romboutsia sp.]|uniref:CAP domain-containing protein n=1 Tax=Romboutsia sp. TaxID=1965302 RepID=UPI003F3FB158